MTYDQIVKYFKAKFPDESGIGAATAARELGYSKFSLYHWRDAGIPLRTQQLISAKTGGALLANERHAKKPVKS